MTFKAKLCQQLENAGILCENGGACDPDLENSHLCQCQPGFYGPFCSKNTPVQNTKCLRQQEISRKLSEILKDLVNMTKTTGAEMEEETDTMEDSDTDMENTVDQWVERLIQEEQLGTGLVRLLAVS